MATTTPRFGITKHADPDPFVTEEIAANWQAIEDRAQGWLPSDTLANRPDPSADIAGFLFWAHDVGQVSICVATTGEGNYAWRSTGVTDHSQLAGEDQHLDHPQYLPSADHDSALHEGFDAATLGGVDLAGMAGAQFYTDHKTTDPSPTIMDATSYYEVINHSIFPPFADGFATYKVTAFGTVDVNGGHTSANLQVRLIIDGNVGDSIFYDIGLSSMGAMASHELEGITNPSADVSMETRDNVGDTSVDARSLFIIALRTS